MERSICIVCKRPVDEEFHERCQHMLALAKHPATLAFWGIQPSTAEHNEEGTYAVSKVRVLMIESGTNEEYETTDEEAGSE
jgi:hypothetical protein